MVYITATVLFAGDAMMKIMNKCFLHCVQLKYSDEYEHLYITKIAIAKQAVAKWKDDNISHGNNRD